MCSRRRASSPAVSHTGSSSTTTTASTRRPTSSTNASLFESLGGFSTHWYRRYGLPFGEDADLGWRAIRAGATYPMESGCRAPPGRCVSLREHLGRQWLARGFPHLVREVPELRRALFYRRLFLTRESARSRPRSWALRPCGAYRRPASWPCRICARLPVRRPTSTRPGASVQWEPRSFRTPCSLSPSPPAASGRGASSLSSAPGVRAVRPGQPSVGLPLHVRNHEAGL